MNPVIETDEPLFSSATNLSKFFFACADNVLDAFAKKKVELFFDLIAVFLPGRTIGDAGAMVVVGEASGVETEAGAGVAPPPAAGASGIGAASIVITTALDATVVEPPEA